MDVRGRHTEGAQHNKPVWADADLRLDPYALPQKMTYERAALSSRRRAFEFTLNARGATLKCDMECGLPLSLALPKRAFEGVAARAFENEDGTSTVTLELLHKDAALSVPLCVSNTVEEAAADWHSWANQLGLPMLVIDEAGQASVVKDPSGLTSHAPKPRRRRSSYLKHRPYFLRRRKVGMIGPVERISADEIIARN